MQKLVEIRYGLGLSQWPAYVIDTRGQHVCAPLEDLEEGKIPASAMVESEECCCTKSLGSEDLHAQGLPQFEVIAPPSCEALQRFRVPEAEAKQAVPKRPLPCCGNLRALRLRLPQRKLLDGQTAERTVLPIVFTGEVSEGCYLKLEVERLAEWHIVLLTVKAEQPLYLEVEQAEGSRLQLDILKHPGFSTWQLLAWRAELGRDAHLSHHSINLDSSAYQVGQVHLNGEGSSLESASSSLIPHYEQQRLDINVDHHAPHTQSSVMNHAVVQGSGRGVYAVRGKIDKSASDSDCQQESRFLTLSPSAVAQSYPVLLIDDYDVKAGHASSVGSIDEETLFYLQSRGLSRESAQQLLTIAFLDPAIHGLVAGSAGRLDSLGRYLKRYLLERV